jgi:hypothetical protein
VKVKRKRLQPTTDDTAVSDYADYEFEDDPSGDEEKTFMAQRAVRSLLYWFV